MISRGPVRQRARVIINMDGYPPTSSLAPRKISRQSTELAERALTCKRQRRSIAASS
jgi:hypothetical protein